MQVFERCGFAKKGRLDKETLVKNLVEKFMREAGHVVESASASSGSFGAAHAVVKRYVQVLRVDLTQKEPEERRSWLLKQLAALLKKDMKMGSLRCLTLLRSWNYPLQIQSGWLSSEILKSNIMDKLIGDLPDSSAAASAPAMGFVVAFFFW